MGYDIDMKEHVRDSAYSLLKSMTTDDALHEIADAVAEAEIPMDALNRMFLSKVLHNKHLYKGWYTLDELVAGTTRKGLYQREFGKAARARAKGGQRNRKGTSRRAPARPGSDATAAFLTAAGIARQMSRDVTFAPFRPVIRDSAKKWTDLFQSAKTLSDSGVQPAEVAGRTLESRAADAGDGALCIVPVDRLAALAVATKGWHVNARALGLVAELVKANLNADPRDGCAPVRRHELPATPGFLKKFLDGKVGGKEWYSKEFFARHQMYVWDAALSCWAFSLAGRRASGEAQAMELLRGVCGLVGQGFRDDVLDMAPSGPVFCSMRDDDSDPYGYRTCVCGVYRAADAARLAAPAAEARAWLMRHNATESRIVGRLLKSDLMTAGASMAAGIPASDMVRMSALFGKWIMW